MAESHLIDIETLRKVVKYDPQTGRLFWLPRPLEFFKPGVRQLNAMGIWNSSFAGKEAFTSIGNHGYFDGSIFCQKYLAHRVIWALHYGEWPSGQIDHINHDRTDNRIENLRCVSHAENGRNMSKKKNNTSGFVGVFFFEKTKKWHSRIQVNGKNIHLGCHTDLQKAIASRKEAERKYGFHSNHGRG